MFRRSVGSPALFAIVYSSVASAIYFSLGIVAKHALGLTPVVFVLVGAFFVVTTMTYVEGSSLHQERGGSATMARYAFNELWSFVAGWAILLDYAILIAITAFAIPHYLAGIWGLPGHAGAEIVVAAAVIAYVAASNIYGLTAHRFARLGSLSLIDIGLQLVVIAIGFAAVFDPDKLVDPIRLGTSPSWRELVYALTIATITLTGLDSASGLAGEVRVGRRGLRRLVSAGTGAVMIGYLGMTVVALSALPVHGGETALGTRFEEMPILGVVTTYHPGWLADTLKVMVALVAAAVLLAASSSAMLGLSRLGYSLATNRQIPSALGKLHPTRSTPVVLILIAAMVAFALVLPANLEFLAGIYAFGVMLAFTLAHLSVCVLRYREADRDRPYRMPLSVRIGGGDLPLPALLGAVVSGAGWISVLVLHEGARYTGAGWMAFGLTLYVVYRRTQGKPVFKRVVIPEQALRVEPEDVAYNIMLVPIFGTPLDDDIVQTAGRLAAEEESKGEGGPLIEAIYVFVIPMSLPLDAKLPQKQVEEARRLLDRAKRVGEEYEGVTVVTAMLRARRAGERIVQEARRRNVEAIVLAAEEPSRIRGGALLGGRSGPGDNFVGEVTKYVIEKAPCRIILTAPPTAPSTNGG
jgi:APA family basic amino acid/polyamine antiporter